MELPEALVKLVGEQGLTAPIAALIFLGLYLWERYGRMQDQKAHQAALKAAADQHVETLKTVIPLVQKMTATMDVTFPLLMGRIGDGR